MHPHMYITCDHCHNEGFVTTMRNRHFFRPIGALVIGISNFILINRHMLIPQMLMPIAQPRIGYWKCFIVVFSLVGLNSAEYQFQNKLTYVNFEIGISKTPSLWLNSPNSKNDRRGTPLNKLSIGIHANIDLRNRNSTPHVTTFWKFWWQKLLKQRLNFNLSLLWWCRSRILIEIKSTYSKRIYKKHSIVW